MRGRVSGQFGAGQFGADSSARKIRRWTIRRGQFGATIRRGQFGAKYIILIYKKIPLSFNNIFLKSRFHSAIFFVKPLPLQQTFLINPASNSAILFIHSFIHSLIHSRIYIAPLQRHYSEVLPTPARSKRTVFNDYRMCLKVSLVGGGAQEGGYSIPSGPQQSKRG